VEWVFGTGTTLEEATGRAIDALGVADDEADVQTVEEPKPGLFGRVRGEFKVRARVRPTAVRPKVERRERRRKGSSGSKDAPTEDSTPTTDETDAPSPTDSAESPEQGEAAGETAAPARPRRSRGGKSAKSSSATDDTATPGAPEAPNEPVAPKRRAAPPKPDQGEPMSTVSVNEQVEVISDFLEGLLDTFGLDGEISSEEVETDIVEIAVDGDDLGLLIGPKGQTLSALHELSRTVAQRKLTGSHEGRVRLDVSGYRQRRREALERFALTVAEDVRSSGVQKVLEPMSPPDRKVIHDALNEVDGVSTASEGEEPRRRVVVLPAS